MVSQLSAWNINEEKVICYQLELLMFQLNAQVAHQGKSDDDWSIQSKRRQVIFLAQVDNR